MSQCILNMLVSCLCPVGSCNVLVSTIALHSSKLPLLLHYAAPLCKFQLLGGRQLSGHVKASMHLNRPWCHRISCVWMVWVTLLCYVLCPEKSNASQATSRVQSKRLTSFWSSSGSRSSRNSHSSSQGFQCFMLTAQRKRYCPSPLFTCAGL